MGLVNRTCSLAHPLWSLARFYTSPHEPEAHGLLLLFRVSRFEKEPPAGGQAAGSVRPPHPQPRRPRPCPRRPRSRPRRPGRAGRGRAGGGDLDALAAVVLDDALQGVVPVVARRREGRKLTRMRSTT